MACQSALTRGAWPLWFDVKQSKSKPRRCRKELGLGVVKMYGVSMWVSGTGTAAGPRPVPCNQRGWAGTAKQPFPGTCAGSCWVASYDRTLRVRHATLRALTPAGEFVLVLVAYLARPWRALCFVCALVNVAMLALWLTVTESPRWLLVTGKVDKATAILRKIAETNGRAMPPMPLASGAAGAAPSESSKFRAAAAAAATAAAEEGRAEAHVRVSSNGAAAGGGGVGGAALGSTPSSTFGVEGLEKREASGQPAAAAAGGQQQQQGNVSLTSMLLHDKHILRRFLILAYVWLVMCMSYYGISMAVGGLPGGRSFQGRHEVAGVPCHASCNGSWWPMA